MEDIEATVGELARTTIHSRARLLGMVAELRAAARGHDLDIEAHLPALLRVCADMETFSPPTYWLATRDWSGLAAPAVIEALARN